MTPKEFDVLAFLAQLARQVFSRAQLLESVWQSSPEWQDPATVTVHVRRIRNKIESRPREARGGSPPSGVSATGSSDERRWQPPTRTTTPISSIERTG